MWRILRGNARLPDNCLGHSLHRQRKVWRSNLELFSRHHYKSIRRPSFYLRSFLSRGFHMRERVGGGADESLGFFWKTKWRNMLIVREVATGTYIYVLTNSSVTAYLRGCNSRRTCRQNWLRRLSIINSQKEAGCPAYVHDEQSRWL